MFKFANKKEKVEKIKSAWPQKIGKVVLWVIIIFLFIRGIGSILKQDNAVKAQEALQQFTETKNYTDKVAQEASAFAELFSLEYLTYLGNTDDYSKRLQPFTDLEFTAGFNDRIQALSSKAYKIQWTDKSKINVDCSVKVRYLNPQGLEIKINNTFLRVAVVEKDGKYTVENYPLFIPEIQKGSKPEVTKIGNDIDTGTKKAILTIVENFVRAYCVGNQVELSYYMADSKAAFNGLNRRYTFKKLIDEGCSVKVLKDGKYFVTVQYLVIDEINSQEFRQNLEMQVISKDGKYLIEKFDSKITLNN